MKICPNCGTSVNDDATFCNNCGASLNSVTPVADAAKDTPSMAPASQPAASAQAAPGNAPIQDGTIHQAPLAPPVMQQNFQQGAYGQPQGQPMGQPYMQQPYFDPKDHTAEFDPKDIADNKLFAILPYLFSCIAGIIVGIYVKDSEFVKFHIKNSIRIDITVLLLLVICIIPFIGWVVAIIGLLVLSVIDIIAIVWAFQGKAKELPIISSIGFLK